MVKHTQTIRLLLPTNFLSVFDPFVEWALKGLIVCGNSKDCQNLRHLKSSCPSYERKITVKLEYVFFYSTSF